MGFSNAKDEMQLRTQSMCSLKRSLSAICLVLSFIENRRNDYGLHVWLYTFILVKFKTRSMGNLFNRINFNCRQWSTVSTEPKMGVRKRSKLVSSHQECTITWPIRYVCVNSGKNVYMAYNLQQLQYHKSVFIKKGVLAHKNMFVRTPDGIYGRENFIWVENWKLHRNSKSWQHWRKH